MIKQIDRVIGDLVRQTEEFKKRGGNPIYVGIVGVNFSEVYTSYEGARAFVTDGRRYKHPIQEARDAIARLEQRAQASFDEFLTLKFVATNTPPNPFSWVDEQEVVLETLHCSRGSRGNTAGSSTKTVLDLVVLGIRHLPDKARRDLRRFCEL